MNRTLSDRAKAQSTFARRLRTRYMRAKAHANVLNRALARSRNPVRKVLAYSAKFVGVSESPPGSNTGPTIDKWGRLFGVHAVYWCGVFVGAMLQHVGVHVSRRVIYGPYIIEDAKLGRNGFEKWITDPKDARAGDVGVLWNGEHINLLRRRPNLITRKVKCRDGNTSSDKSGSQSNGGCVANKTRSISDFDGWARPRYPKVKK